MSDTNVQAEPTYRQANINDADAISAVITEVVKEPDPVAFDRALSPDEVRTWIMRMGGEGGAFLAMIDGNVVGFAALDYNTFEPDTVVLGVWLLARRPPQGHRHLARRIRARLRPRQGLQAHPRPSAAGQRDRARVPQQHRRPRPHLQPRSTIRTAACLAQSRNERQPYQHPMTIHLSTYPSIN